MPQKRRAFTLVELLVVIGIISLLIALLLPAIPRASRQAQCVQCMSNLRSIGQLLQIYANNNGGIIYPIGALIMPGDPGYLPSDWGTYRTLGELDFNPDGSPVTPDERWPVYVFDPAIWNPPIMRCPTDSEVLNNPNSQQHSYLLNHHLEESPEHMVKLGTYVPDRPSSSIIVMGEKKTEGRRLLHVHRRVRPPRAKSSNSIATARPTRLQLPLDGLARHHRKCPSSPKTPSDPWVLRRHPKHRHRCRSLTSTFFSPCSPRS